MEEFWNIVKLDLFISQPQIFVGLWFCLSFVDMSRRRQIRKIYLFALCHSVYTDSMINYIPLQVQFANSVVAATLLMFFIFRELSVRTKIVQLVFFYLVSTLVELIVVSAVIRWDGPVDPVQVRADIPAVVSILYPCLLVLVVVGALIRYRKILLLKRIYSLLTEESRKPLVQVVTLVAFQTILMCFFQFTQISLNRFNLPFAGSVLIYSAILISLLAFVAVIRLLVSTKEHAVRTTQEGYIEDINNMFTSIRGQRHDFLNHLQVIHTMAQMNRIEQLKSYVGELVHETREVHDIVSHASPALAAFAHAKMTVAAGNGVDLTFELPNDWNVSESSIKIIDVIKILGYLIDHTLEKRSSSVDVRIGLEGGSLVLRVRAVDLVYTRGGSADSGTQEQTEWLLTIVRERIKHYRGTFNVYTDKENNTLSYEVSLPQFDRLLA